MLKVVDVYYTLTFVWDTLETASGLCWTPSFCSFLGGSPVGFTASELGDIGTGRFNELGEVRCVAGNLLEDAIGS